MKVALAVAVILFAMASVVNAYEDSFGGPRLYFLIATACGWPVQPGYQILERRMIEGDASDYREGLRWAEEKFKLLKDVGGTNFCSSQRSFYEQAHEALAGFR
jgi:hypothetical protein